MALPLRDLRRGKRNDGKENWARTETNEPKENDEN